MNRFSKTIDPAPGEWLEEDNPYNSVDVIVQFYDISSGEIVQPDVRIKEEDPSKIQVSVAFKMGPICMLVAYVGEESDVR